MEQITENNRLFHAMIKVGTQGDVTAFEDALRIIKEIEQDGSTTVRDSRERFVSRQYDEDNFRTAHEYSAELREYLSQAEPENDKDGQLLLRVYRDSLLFDAPFDFDCFCRYIEWDREEDKKFYMPRRKQLLPLARALQRLEERKIHLLCISMPPGTGKALANDTPILTRDGWKRHGDLIVGDEVIGMDGKFKKVTAVHPKCMLDRLVKFSNGEQIVCHERHEWMYFDRACGKIKTSETKDIEKRALHNGGTEHKRGHRYTIQLPHRKYIIGEHKELPLDPYTLGVWLGDGANKNPRICCAEKDKCVIDRIISNGIRMKQYYTHKDTGVLYFDFDIRKQLQQLGMCHSRRITPKHIPEEYLTASIGQRFELLEGLLDTDGTLAGRKYQFTTSEEPLRDSFCDLISTFGWRTCVKTVKPKTSSSGIIARKNHYVISFTPDINVICEIERKRNKTFAEQRAIGFVSIEKVSPVEGNCITVEGDGMYLAGRTMLPTHNTTLAEFFLAWTGGKHPELPSIVGSHNNDFLRGVYDEVQRIVGKRSEYLWQKVFPNVRLVGTNAKSLMLDLGTRKRFSTYEFSSIGSGNAGKIRAANILYCDDLVDGIETAMNRDRLDKLWQQYTVDYRQRKIGDCAELHIATRWSVHDVIGRLEDMYGEDPTAEFIVCPALDEHDQSNFDYPYGVGFTTDFYHEQREIMDSVSWKALYENSPIEREGQLYPPNQLQRYFELPEGDPDAILGVCDTKTTGSDYCVMPIVFQYGQKFYIEDVLCENYAPNIVEINLVTKICKWNPHMIRFESNVAGGKLASDIQTAVKEKECRTKIETRWTQQNKETKILVEAHWVMEHCVFKDDSVLHGDENREYRKFLQLLTSYSLEGKNKHDDAPDAMAQLSQYIQSFAGNKIQIVRRMF